MRRRSRIYIVNDIILKLIEYGELSQTALISYCGINKIKPKSIIDDLELHELEYIVKNQVVAGKRPTTIYRPTQKGLEFSRSILDLFEIILPRRNNTIDCVV
jgi:predicted transcriptional regulator